MELADFLRARLDEDEQVARAVEDRSAPWDGQWVPDGPNALRTRNGHVLTYGHVSTDGRALPLPLKPGLVEHWARHDPARVLAEVEAKRRVLRLHEDSNLALMAASGTVLAGGVKVRRRAYEDVLKLLALPYADHPDYDASWKP